MKLLGVCSFFCVLMSLSSASWACAGIVNGISGDKLSQAVQAIEEKLDDTSDLKYFNDLRYHWEKIEGSAGLEGDCGAITVKAQVNISAISRENKFCAFSAEVTFVDSSAEFLKVYKAKVEELFCL